ncbi:hypothetical protein HQ544_04890 [Candidatus Falkowbacteria bacterium]|nr:hypothetical protein [Candidatus Falkowbacteria bacterium]
MADKPKIVAMLLRLEPGEALTEPADDGIIIFRLPRSVGDQAVFVLDNDETLVLPVRGSNMNAPFDQMPVPGTERVVARTLASVGHRVIVVDDSDGKGYKMFSDTVGETTLEEGAGERERPTIKWELILPDEKAEAEETSCEPETDPADETVKKDEVPPAMQTAE